MMNEQNKETLMRYEAPKMEVLDFSLSDVVTTSLCVHMDQIDIDCLMDIE